MERIHLIQRLEAPREFDNPFSFGGGYKNGGLTDEAMDLLRPIFSFDYMGSAEFEFGRLPKALNTIALYAVANQGITGIVELARPALYICSNEQEAHVKDLIEKLSTEKGERELRLKEQTLFPEALKDEEHFGKYKGWLELDNGFMFFLDSEMHRKTAELFGIK